MKILFIGGNGNISWHCTQLAIERGHEVWQLNREISLATRRQIQTQVHKLKGDMRETAEVKRLLDSCSFDVVCDFICYNGEHARSDIDIFQDKIKHFFFISSESVYKRDSLVDTEFYTEGCGRSLDGRQYYSRRHVAQMWRAFYNQVIRVREAKRRKKFRLPVNAERAE